MITGIVGAIVTFVAGVLFWVVTKTKQDQGRLKEQAETAQKNAVTQKRMAAVPRPSDDEALSRLDDGTA